MTEPTGLEDRVVASLKRQGLVHPSSRFDGRHLGGAAVGLVALIAVGFMLRTPEPEGNTYMLALYEGPAYVATPPDAGDRHAEYARWSATSQIGSARVIGGEELAGRPEVLGRDAPPGPQLAGYFLVRAASAADALALARTSPHLRYGGTIVLREVKA